MLPPRGHRVAGVHHQIGQNLLELRGVGADVHSRSQRDDEIDVGSRRVAGESLHLRDERVDLEDLELDRLAPREGEELRGWIARALRALADRGGSSCVSGLATSSTSSGASIAASRLLKS